MDAITSSIEALTASMEANSRRYKIEIGTGQMTQKLHKSLNDAYHHSRIEREILLGNIPITIRW